MILSAKVHLTVWWPRIDLHHPAWQNHPPCRGKMPPLLFWSYTSVNMTPESHYQEWLWGIHSCLTLPWVFTQPLTFHLTTHHWLMHLFSQALYLPWHTPTSSFLSHRCLFPCHLTHNLTLCQPLPWIDLPPFLAKGTPRKPSCITEQVRKKAWEDDATFIRLDSLRDL